MLSRKSNEKTNNKLYIYRDLQRNDIRGTFEARTREVTAVRTYRVGICSRDPAYASNLMLALNRVSEGKVEAMVFSSPNLILTCMPVQEPDLIVMDGFIRPDRESVHIVTDSFARPDRSITDSELYETESPDDDRKKASEWKKELGIEVVVLTETPSVFGIYKYQSVRGICKELLERLHKQSAAGSQRSGCIAVFSPLGRCGKTTLARALARAEESRGGLYIGMEEYADRTVHSEVLYQIHRRSPDVYEAVVRELTSEEGVCCLRLSDTYSDLLDVQRSDLEWFHEQLLQPERYRTLIYDVGGASLSSPEVLECFDHILMPVLPGNVAVGKVERFRSSLREAGLGGLLCRIHQVELPADAIERMDESAILACINE